MYYHCCEFVTVTIVMQSLVGLQSADKTKTHAQTKLQNCEMHPLLLEATIGRYRHNNGLIPIIGKTADTDYWGRLLVAYRCISSYYFKF